MVTCLSPDDDEFKFLACDEETGVHFRLSLSPLNCLSYTDDVAIENRSTKEKYLIFCLPNFYLEKSFRATEWASLGFGSGPEFRELHGYEIIGEEIAAS